MNTSYKGMTFIKGFFTVTTGGESQDFIKMVNNKWLIITSESMGVYPDSNVDESQGAFWGESEGSIDYADDIFKICNQEGRLPYFVAEFLSENTGGGCMVDALMLPDGRYIGITDESVVLYPPAPCEDEFLQGDYDTPHITLL